MHASLCFLMGDNSVPFIESGNHSPSIYRIWQQVRREGGSEPEMLDRYRELLEKYGHRDVQAMKW